MIMLVALNSCWKVTIAYFLVNGMSSQEKCNVVNLSLKMLHETGVIVKTLTFDGAASNIAMAKCLGANLMSQIDQVIYSLQMSHTIAKGLMSIRI